MKKLVALALLSVAGASFAQTFVGAGFSIPDNVPVGVSSSITLVPAVSTVNFVTIHGFTHTWVGDLIVTLSKTGGGSVDLFKRVGSTTTTGVGSLVDLNGDYKFQVGGADFWAATTGVSTIAPGTYAPTTNDLAGTHAATNFSTFAAGAAGTYTLTISDNALGDVGAITSWDLNVSPVPEPASFAILGLGALALVRRRKNSK